jgi:hypothetical protein
MERTESSIVVPRTHWLWPRGSAVLPCVLAVVMFGDHWWPILFGTKKLGLSDVLFPSLYLLTAGIFTLLTFRSFVRLSEDSIEVSRVWGSKVLPFDKIKGRRRYTEKADPYSTPARHLVLEPNDDRFSRLDIKESDKFDESFYRWFDSLPDLDKQDGIEVSKSKYENFSLV